MIAQNGFAIVNPAALGDVPTRVPRDGRPERDRGRDRRGPAGELPDLGPRLAGGARPVERPLGATTRSPRRAACSPSWSTSPRPPGAEGRVADRIEAHCAATGRCRSRRVPSETGRDSLVVGAARSPPSCSPPTSTRSPRPGPPGRSSTATSSAGSARPTTRVASSPACSRRAALVEAGEDLDALGVAFAFPVDEERGGSGSRTLALALEPRYAIALEATGLRHRYGRDRRHRRLGPRARPLGPRRADRDRRERDPRVPSALIAALPSLGLGRHEPSAARRVGARGRRDPRRNGVQHRPRPLQLPAPGPAGSGPGRARDPGGDRAARRRARGYVELVEMTSPFETPGDSPPRRRADRGDRGGGRRGPGTDRRPGLDRRPQLRRLRGRRGGRLRPRRLLRSPICPRSTSTSTRWSAAPRCSRRWRGRAGADDPGLGRDLGDRRGGVADLLLGERRGDLDPDPRRALWRRPGSRTRSRRRPVRAAGG